MSDLPRVTFNDDGLSMNIDEAVERFRERLERVRGLMGGFAYTFNLAVEVRPCDCETTLSGRDEMCPEHGNPLKLLAQEAEQAE